MKETVVAQSKYKWTYRKSTFVNSQSGAKPKKKKKKENQGHHLEI